MTSVLWAIKPIWKGRIILFDLHTILCILCISHCKNTIIVLNIMINCWRTNGFSYQQEKLKVFFHEFDILIVQTCQMHWFHYDLNCISEAHNIKHSTKIIVLSENGFQQITFVVFVRANNTILIHLNQITPAWDPKQVFFVKQIIDWNIQ